MKKTISLLLSILILATGIFSVSAVVAPDDISAFTVALYSKNDLTFNGSGQVRGDAIIESGKLRGSNNPWAIGSIYKTADVEVKDKFLRVDNDRFFRYVKFHFVKGDYLKLTAVDQVLPTPLESLSVNFPLGSTIKVDAVVKNQIVETKCLFVDSSVYSHNWNY